MEHPSSFNNNSDKIYLTTKDYLLTGETFSLVKKGNEGLLETFPQPKENDLSKYYDSKEYVSHTDSKKGLINFFYRIIKKYSTHQKVKLIQKTYKQKGLLLDIGAGTGDFLFATARNGWNVKGIEVNDRAKKLALKKGIFLIDNFDALKEMRFDVITLWHVLEHLPNLEEVVIKIENHLKPNGVLIIAVPNYNSFDAAYYKEFWAAYDVPRHLWHFSKESMKYLFPETIRLIKTKPMIFDAFYVSLLSEKYKSGTTFSLKAIWVGFLSNLKAWKTKEYSSQIYIFKKQKA